MSRAVFAQCPPPDSGALEIKLHAAILENDANTVVQMISLGANPNARDPYGNTLLMCAADDNKNFLIVKLLISYKADVNATSNSGSTALMDACDEDNNLEIIEHLLKSGADVNAQYRDGSTVLMNACLDNNISLVKLLLDSHADVNLPTYDGEMAIDYIDEGDTTTAAVKALLIAAGAKPYGKSTPAFVNASHEAMPKSMLELSSKIDSTLNIIEKYYISYRTHNRDTNADYYDSLYQASHFLRFYLIINLPKVSWSLTGELPKGKQVWASTSKDKKIRVWGWDSYMGGSMPRRFQIIQYTTPYGIKIYDPNPLSGRDYAHNYYCDTIYSVKQNDGQTIYIFTQNWKADGRSYGQTLEAMTIHDSSLVHVKNFFESDNGFNDDLYYYFPDPTEYPSSQMRSISYNYAKKMLFVPENDDKDSPGKKYFKYFYDGTKFVKVRK